MYTSYIGKKFLKLYNHRNSSNLSARNFFDEIFFLLFFDDEQHLMHVGNSPFFQRPSGKALEGGLTKSRAQLKKLHQDIENEPPNMAIFVGYAAKDVTGTTSGQLTTLDFRINPEEMYASWIGEALGIGVSGGFVMLLDNDVILWNLYEGWNYYRHYLKQTPNLKDKQIETWNGKWLTHTLSEHFDKDEPTALFALGEEEVLGKLAIATQSWSEVLFALARRFPNSTLTAYAYNLSQTNTTLGFVNLCLPEIKLPFELRDKIFLNKEDSVLSDKQIQKLSTYYSFKSACKFGTIGIKALEPDKLREFMPPPIGRGKEYKFTDETSYIQFQLYKIWIIAMLNKTELLDSASAIAKILRETETLTNADNRGKNSASQEIKTLRDAKNKREFIESLTGLLEKTPQHADNFHQVVENIVKMPVDSFPLFLTLIRFEYQFQKSK